MKKGLLDRMWSFIDVYVFICFWVYLKYNGKKEKLIQLNLHKIKNNCKSKLPPPKCQNMNGVFTGVTSSLGHLCGTLVIPNSGVS